MKCAPFGWSVFVLISTSLFTACSGGNQASLEKAVHRLQEGELTQKIEAIQETENVFRNSPRGFADTQEDLPPIPTFSSLPDPCPDVANPSVRANAAEMSAAIKGFARCLEPLTIPYTLFSNAVS